MRQPLVLLLRRVTVGALALAGTWVTVGSPAAAPAQPTPEAAHLAFTERFRALQHGGIVRAANASISCRAASAGPGPLPPSAHSCTAARAGGQGTNGDFDMDYIDVDQDPNTYNSSRAEVRLPKGSRVTYARLYWGGNLRVGEQKPPEDTGRVLIAEPGGEYKELLADTVTGHRVTHDADAYQASADVTRLVRESGGGLYTVAQVDVAKGNSAAGAWGGWTLVVAYENPAEPLRHLSLWDGFTALNPRSAEEIRLSGRRFPGGAGGRVGLVAYNGDHGTVGDSLHLTYGQASRRPDRPDDHMPGSTALALGDPANPADDVLNSTIEEPGDVPPERSPAYANNLGYDSDVFDLGERLAHQGDQLTLRLLSRRDAAWAGVLFVAVDAQP
ncbi:DUF3344 domain-containing protein [Streptomyces anandii]|uniref:DUF3344 domain-containing protein n=1 Tax=Streptomyces anandii TaxID=285454 RepID=UPI0016773579|nr:DUF3344 domain-containing protein [Streptomyces anandii]GGX86022.1 hypothetical protein GCM10010510_33860 [Streptomyces anandii JCM 4720]